jgi:GNAT superfamily N-acetyltransferase
VKIKFSFVTEKNLDSLPESPGSPHGCKYCIYWEFPEEYIRSDKKKTKELMMQKKLGWLRMVGNEFGDCAIILYVNEEPVGYAQYAPSKFLPNLAHYPVIPSPDAVLISCLYIFKKKHRRHGFGTILLNAVLENLENRAIKLVEAIARKGNANNPAGPVEFYLKNEFIIYKDDKEFSLMRLEL